MRKTFPLQFAAPVMLAMLALPTCAPQDDTVAEKTAKIVTKKDRRIDKAEDPPPESLKERVKLALDVVHKRPLQINHNFWTVFHGILGMGLGTELVDYGGNGEIKKRVKAIDRVCQEGQNVTGLKFTPTAYGVDVETQAGTGVGQGHQDQFIAEMAQWGLPRDTEFIVEGKKYTFSDFHKHSMMRASVTANQELSWAIIIISEFYGTDYHWTNSAGEKVSFEDVVHYELNQPVDESAACGGTHRLFGFTWAYHRHRERGGKKEGVWKAAAEKIEEFKKQAKECQNGEYCWTNFVSGKREGEDLASTGHVIEWLALALTDNELKQGWVEEAVNALAMSIIRGRDERMDGGAFYHAAHGLHIYYNRRWGPLAGSLGSDPVIPPTPKD
jgi:hypothetical protein